MKIGFFDSGLGGLTILEAVRAHLPQYDYEYFGDTANLPYGDKTEWQICGYVKAAVEELFAKDCKLVVIACNSASVETLRVLQDELIPEKYPDRRILGVVIPVVEEVIASHSKRLVLLATNRTVSSGKYQFELGKRQIEHIKVESVAMPGLVDLIESGVMEQAEDLVWSEILKRAGYVDGIILGCTHYTVLKDFLRAKVGDKITVFSQDEIIPRKLEAYLQKHPEIEQSLSRTGSSYVHLSEFHERYQAIIERLTTPAVVGEVV